MEFRSSTQTETGFRLDADNQAPLSDSTVSVEPSLFSINDEDSLRGLFLNDQLESFIYAMSKLNEILDFTEDFVFSDQKIDKSSSRLKHALGILPNFKRVIFASLDEISFLHEQFKKDVDAFFTSLGIFLSDLCEERDSDPVQVRNQFVGMRKHTEMGEDLYVIQTHLQSVLRQVYKLGESLLMSRPPTDIAQAGSFPHISQPCVMLTEVLDTKTHFASAIKGVLKKRPELGNAQETQDTPLEKVYHTVRSYVYRTIQHLKDALVQSLLDRQFLPPQLPKSYLLDLNCTQFYNDVLAFYGEIRDSISFYGSACPENCNWLEKRKELATRRKALGNKLQQDREEKAALRSAMSLEKTDEQAGPTDALEGLEKLFLAIDFLLKRSRWFDKSDLKEAQKAAPPSHSAKGRKASSRAQKRPRLHQAAKVFREVKENDFESLGNGVNRKNLWYGDFYFQITNGDMNRLPLDSLLRELGIEPGSRILLLNDDYYKCLTGFFVFAGNCSWSDALNEISLITNAYLEYRGQPSRPVVNLYTFGSRLDGPELITNESTPGNFNFRLPSSLIEEN